MSDVQTNKLEVIAGEMGVESAEDKNQHAPPKPLQLGFERAPCGHSPHELRRAYDESTQVALTSLDKKRNSLGIHNAVMPGGQRISLLKTMLTTACERNCFYCPFRAGRSAMKRVSFKPDEMASVFGEMSRARYAEVGRSLGFLHVASGPLVRSSYRAAEAFLEGILHGRAAPEADRYGKKKHSLKVVT